MRQTEEKIIDGLKYEITQFSATKSLKLLTRLASYFSEPIGIIIDKGGFNAELSSNLISQIANSLFTKLDEVQVDRTIKELLEGVRCEGKIILFDTHFQGRLFHLFKVLKAILEVQYSDFFDELQKLGGLEAAQLKSSAQQP